MMKGVIEGVVSAIVVGALLFFVMVVGTIVGGILGWCVEHTFVADFVGIGFNLFGLHIENSQLPAVGAVLGFVGGFFKSTASHSKD
jgi:hypothetical protein